MSIEQVKEVRSGVSGVIQDLAKFVSDNSAIKCIADLAIACMKALETAFKTVAANKTVRQLTYHFAAFSGILGAWALVSEVAAWLQGKRTTPLEIARGAVDLVGSGADVLDFFQMTEVLVLPAKVAAASPFSLISLACGTVSFSLGIASDAKEVIEQKKTHAAAKKSHEKSLQWRQLFSDSPEALRNHYRHKQNGARTQQKLALLLRPGGFEKLCTSKRMKTATLYKAMKESIVKRNKAAVEVAADAASAVSCAVGLSVLVALIAGAIASPWIPLAASLIALSIAAGKYLLNVFYFDRKLAGDIF